MYPKTTDPVGGRQNVSVNGQKCVRGRERFWWGAVVVGFSFFTSSRMVGQTVSDSDKPCPRGMKSYPRATKVVRGRKRVSVGTNRGRGRERFGEGGGGGQFFIFHFTLYGLTKRVRGLTKRVRGVSEEGKCCPRATKVCPWTGKCVHGGYEIAATVSPYGILFAFETG